MNGRMWGLVVGGLAMLTGAAGNAQDLDARTLVETSLRAMGGENMTSIRYSASDGYIGAWGQNYSPAHDWPSNQLTRYMRTIDYEARSSQEAFTVVQGTGEGTTFSRAQLDELTDLALRGIATLTELQREALEAAGVKPGS